MHTKELEKDLLQPKKEVTWVTREDNRHLSFNVKALLPCWTPQFKFICNRLITTTHTSHVTMDCVILFYEMIEKKVDAWWIIYNNIISVGPTKGLWFPTIITKLSTMLGVPIDKNEEKVKVGLAITTKASRRTTNKRTMHWNRGPGGDQANEGNLETNHQFLEHLAHLEPAHVEQIGQSKY